MSEVMHAAAPPANSRPARAVRSRKLRALMRNYEVLMQRLRCLRDAENDAPRTIGVTSCRRGEGVSTVASNLAVVAARSDVGSTLLVDASFRNPSVARHFRLDNGVGLVDVLAGEIAPAEAIVETAEPNLYVLPAGRLIGGTMARFDPAKAVVREAIETIRRDHALAIFDLPPANDHTACFPLAGLLDGILLVIEAEKVDRDRARRTRRQLAEAGAELLGSVFNKRRDYRPWWLRRRE